MVHAVLYNIKLALKVGTMPVVLFAYRKVEALSWMGMENQLDSIAVLSLYRVALFVSPRDVMLRQGLY